MDSHLSIDCLKSHPEQAHDGTNRVDAEIIAQLLDDILSLSGNDHPYTVYRSLAERAAVHPTTVLRCHQGKLATGSATLLRCARQTLEQLRANGATQNRVRPKRKRQTRSRLRQDRVPTKQIQREIDILAQLLGIKEHQFLYRYLAENIEVHPTTVFRYHRGELQSAPKQLLDKLKQLREQIALGQPVVFNRGRNGTPLILRERVVRILDDIFELSYPNPKSEVFRRLEDQLKLDSGALSRVYYDKKLRFVPAGLFGSLERVLAGSEYDPCLTYDIGSRINHHQMGPGMVVRKVHKNKILVRLADGGEVLLCENMPVDPFFRGMEQDRTEKMSALH